MKRLATLALGLMTLLSASGCCCHHMGRNACSTGACPPAMSPSMSPSPLYVPQGQYAPYGMQTGMVTTAPMTASTVIQGPVYPMTAMGPLETLPTY